MKDLSILPENLPVPIDDGACDHLLGLKMPSVSLSSTSNEKVCLASITGTVVFYFYPMIGRPDSPPLVGWNEIPGARGCTPQSLSFRDESGILTDLNAKVFGVSAQNLEEQIETKNRLLLPFELLNDSSFILANALRLPTFEYNDSKLIKRITLIVINGVIRKVFYPVFPPDKNASAVSKWLEENAV